MIDLGNGGLEFWILGALVSVALLKVLGDLVGRYRETAASPEGPFLVHWPVRERPPGQPRVQPWAPRETPPVAPPPAAPVARTPPPAERPAMEEETSDTIRIDTGSDGRVQFLPGRLEVVRGAEAGREYHFLRIPGQDVPTITVGRTHGAPHRHIQIPEPTVSRLHARLRYVDGVWRIANLSMTNPLRINGEDAGPSERGVALADGDRIQLGEVELCYRDPRP